VVTKEPQNNEEINSHGSPKNENALVE